VPKGFIDRANFEYFFEYMVVEEIKKRRRQVVNCRSQRALIISDGHSSRCSTKVMTLARSNNIDIFILPSHLTHIIQPLDCGINRDFKYRLGTRICNEEKHSSADERRSFITALCTSIDSSLVMGNIINSWEKSGLYPFNPSRILKGQRLFAPKSTAQTHRGVCMVCLYIRVT
jgi:hypothetical protein